MPEPAIHEWSPTSEQREVLLETATGSIAHGLRRGRPLPLDGKPFDAMLMAPAACFVTLHRGGALRGCIGTLQARRPLIEEVSHQAYAAAFQDPRFAAVGVDELAELEISLSVLTTPQPFPVRDEQDLLARLEPGVDGLILEDGPHRATFLPSVWEQLPDPATFLAHLKRKARLAADDWSPTIRFQRYRSVSVK